jgi:hypothetical protein
MSVIASFWPEVRIPCKRNESPVDAYVRGNKMLTSDDGSKGGGHSNFHKQIEY